MGEKSCLFGRERERERERERDPHTHTHLQALGDVRACDAVFLKGRKADDKLVRNASA